MLYFTTISCSCWTPPPPNVLQPHCFQMKKRYVITTSTFQLWFWREFRLGPPIDDDERHVLASAINILQQWLNNRRWRNCCRNLDPQCSNIGSLLSIPLHFTQFCYHGRFPPEGFVRVLPVKVYRRKCIHRSEAILASSRWVRSMLCGWFIDWCRFSQTRPSMNSSYLWRISTLSFVLPLCKYRLDQCFDTRDWRHGSFQHTWWLFQGHLVSLLSRLASLSRTIGCSFPSITWLLFCHSTTSSNNPHWPFITLIQDTLHASNKLNFQTWKHHNTRCLYGTYPRSYKQTTLSPRQYLSFDTSLSSRDNIHAGLDLGLLRLPPAFTFDIHEASLIQVPSRVGLLPSFFFSIKQRLISSIPYDVFPVPSMRAS